MSSSLFVNTLRRCGIFIDIPPTESDGTVLITCPEPRKSFRQLDSQFRIQRTKTNDFLTSMDAFFELPQALFSSLISMEEQSLHERNPQEVDNAGGIYGQSDTFLKLLLRIEALQDTVIEMLLGKMLLLAGEISPLADNATRSNVCKQERVITKIFNHIRWCEYLFSPEKVVKISLESLQVLPRSLQIEIIASIPAILTATSISDDLLSELLSLAQSVPSLLPCILDTIGNLCLSYGSDCHKAVVNFAIEELNNADINILPIITRFLLESAGTDSVEYIWRQTRSKLVQFIDTWDSSSANCGESEIAPLICQSQDWLDFQSILINLLRTTLTTSPAKSLLFQTMIGTLTEVSSQESEICSSDNGALLANELSVFDLWLLLALADWLPFRTKVQTCLIKQIEFGRMSSSLIHKALLHYPAVASVVFSSALSCAQSLLTYNRVGKLSNVKNAHSMGVWIYLALFNSLQNNGTSSGSRKQEVLVALVGHISSPVQSEADSGLLVLSSLANAEHAISLQKIREKCLDQDLSPGSPSHRISPAASSLRVFLPFIKSLLEDVHSLKDYQQRILFRVIFQCAMANPDLYTYCESGHSSSINSDQIGPGGSLHVQSAPIDDVMILLKKFASSMDKKTRKIGIAGHTAHLMEEALLHTVSTRNNIEDTENPDQRHEGSNEDANLPYIQRLESLLNMTARDTEGHVFLLEELTTQIEMYAGVLKDTALIRYLRYDVEDQLFQFIDGLSMEEVVVDENQCEKESAKSTSSQKDAARIQYITGRNKRLHCMQSSIFFDINGPKMSTAYAKIYPTVVLDVRRRRDLAAQLITDAGVDYSSVLSSKSVSTGQFLCPLLEPILYLVTACERCMGGNLTQLGLLLGIPLELPREDLMDIAEDYNETDREIICASIFYGVIWLRSLLNIFTYVDRLPPQEYYKLVLRMNQLVELEASLCDHIQRFPKYLEILAPDAHESVGKYNIYTGKKVSRSSGNLGKRIAKKDKEKLDRKNTKDKVDSSVVRSTDNVGIGPDRLIMSDLEAFLEISILKPLTHHVPCILGFGIEPLIYTPDEYPTGLTQATPFTPGQSMPTPAQSLEIETSASRQPQVTQLSDRAILKLLKSIVQWCSHKIVTLESCLDPKDGLIEKVNTLLNHGVFRGLRILVSRLKHFFRPFPDKGESENTFLASELPAELQTHLQATKSKPVHAFTENFLMLEQVVLIYCELLKHKDVQDDFLSAVGSCGKHSNRNESKEENCFHVPVLVRVSLDLSNNLNDNHVPTPEKYNCLNVVANCYERAFQGIFDIFYSIALILLKHRAKANNTDLSMVAGNDCDENIIEFEESDGVNSGNMGTVKSGEKAITSGTDTYMKVVVRICNILDMLVDLIVQALKVQNVSFTENENVINNTLNNTLSALVVPSGIPLQLSDLCKSLLQYDWANSRIQKANSNCKEYTYTAKDVGFFVHLWLKHSPDTLTTVQFIVNELFMEDLKLMHPGDSSETFPTLNINSCVHYYQPLLQTLTFLWEKMQSKLEKGEIKNTIDELSSSGSEDADLNSLVDIVECFSSLIMLTKYEGNTHTKAGVGLNRRAILLLALREGRIFMESFMSTSKNLHVLFSKYQTIVLRLLGRLQKATRQLQSLALYGKRIRDKLLSQEGPKLKKVLEQVIYCIKNMAQDSVGAGAVYVGNLRSRDISGKEIVEESESESEVESDEESSAYEEEDETDNMIEKILDANKENENASADIDEGKESNNVNHKRTYSTDDDEDDEATISASKDKSADLSQLFAETSQSGLPLKRVRHNVVASDSD